MKALAASILLLLVVLPARAATRTAHVSVPALSPFTVKGSKFLQYERVRVAVRVKLPHVQRVTASARGTFTARFRRVRAGSCTPYVVRATGSRGSVATLKVVPPCASP